MSQQYSDPSRESDPHALPDAEVFYISQKEIDSIYRDTSIADAGWYYWFCFPGCLPDSDAIGPFETEAEAIEASHEN